MVQASAFLALEASLALRLSSTLGALTSKLYPSIQKELEARRWESADHLIRGLDLAPVFDLNEAYIVYLSKVAVLFGASRVTSTPGTSAVGLGFENATVRLMIESLRLSIQYNIKDSIIETGLQLIATAKEKALPLGPTFANVMKAGSYLGSVLKAGKPSAMLPFATFMGKDGKAKFDIASSLHTSRLSAFGYTAEASYLGITEYVINEQLDSRTCDICTEMHGKVFNVDDARNLLDIVIRTQDPDELKSLQPWPSQSKESVQEVSLMTSNELVARGWNVPPFHPRCRGLLAKFGKAPDLTAGKTAQVLENYVATKDDFSQLGIKLSPAKVDLWNKVMQTSPAEVVAKLSGVSQDKLLSTVMGAKDPQDLLGLANLSVTQTGVNIELQTTVFGSKSPVVQDYYFKKDQSLYVGSIEVAAQDTGVAKKLLSNLYGVAKETSMTSMQMVADSGISGYAWAKYGFTPASSRQWSLVRSQIRAAPAKMALIKGASELESNTYLTILKSTDPKSIFALADLPMGEALLLDTVWLGALDFMDAESVSRFIANMGGGP